MIEIDGRVYRPVNIAFHFVRDNVWAPWEVIGVYLTCDRFVGAKYLREHSRIEDDFHDEVRKAERYIIAGTVEFLNLWRANHQEWCSVIGPIITYFTYSSELPRCLDALYNQYVGSPSQDKFAAMAIMLKMKEGFFSGFFKDFDPTRKKIVKKLKEAGQL